MKGGELITRVLSAHGVGTVFSVAGASHSHLLDPLDRAGIHIISNRHEAGAVGGADGYARTRRGLGVALIVADQGLPNAVGALAVAAQALSPVLLLVATPPRIFVEADATIDQDKLALVAPLAKWARTVPEAERLGDYLQTAIKYAQSGRRGPVVLLIPEQLLQAECPAFTDELRAASAPIPPAAEAIAQAAEWLVNSKRPLIVAGNGAAWSGAGDILRSLSSQFGIPVFMNALARGLVPEDDELGFSWPYGQLAAKEADTVLLVGARLTQRLGLGLPPRFAADARFIQIDVEASAFHRNRATDLPIWADANLALCQLQQVLAETTERCGQGPGWVRDALKPRAERIAQLQTQASEQIHPLQLAAAIQQRLPEQSMFVADGADIATWMYGAIRLQRQGSFIDHYPMGAMGSCTAMAVGAAAAERELHGAQAAPVVLVTGGGALGFHPAELAAAAQAGLKLVVIVGNDGAWGTELHGQQQAIGRDINTRLGQLPYEKLAEAFGLEGIRVAAPVELESALDQAFTAKGPVLVNVLIDPQAGAELKTNPAVRMILFSDILSGQANLKKSSGRLDA